MLQASGRPFGDLSRSLLATERLVLLKGSNIHIRDTGILFYHLKRYEEAYDALRAYRSKVKKALPEPEEDAVVPEIQQRVGSPAQFCIFKSILLAISSGSSRHFPYDAAYGAAYMPSCWLFGSPFCLV